MNLKKQPSATSTFLFFQTHFLMNPWLIQTCIHILHHALTGLISGVNVSPSTLIRLQKVNPATMAKLREYAGNESHVSNSKVNNNQPVRSCFPVNNKGHGIYFFSKAVTLFLLCVNLTPVLSPFVCLQLEVMLEDNLTLPSNGKLYSKVLNWVQRSLWENGDQLERLMEEVSTRACSLNSQTDFHSHPAPSFPSDSCFWH